MFRRFTAGYTRLLSWLLAFSVAVLMIPVSLQIFSRYTQLIPAYIWTEEMARFLFIWMVMIGAMIGVREGSHFEVDVWPTLGAKGHAALQLVSGIFILVFAGVFLRPSQFQHIAGVVVRLANPVSRNCCPPRPRAAGSLDSAARNLRNPASSQPGAGLST